MIQTEETEVLGEKPVHYQRRNMGERNKRGKCPTPKTFST
jgi:hypothetical protein